MTLGLRYDRVAYRFESYMTDTNFISNQERTFDRLAPKLSAVWKPDSTTSLFASTGRGFEVPAIGEIAPSPGTRFRSLYPKSLWNYEVGARRMVGDRALLEGAVFYADVRGEFVPQTVESQSRPENASRSRNIGVELAVIARATRHIQLIANYSFLDLRLRNYTTATLDSTGGSTDVDFAGKSLPGVARHRVTGEARVRPLATLDVGVQVEWQTRVYVETGNADVGVWYVSSGASVQQVPFRAVPARALLHLNAAWRFGQATLFGNVENLFGLRYVGSILANEATGRFYEAGSPTALSLGIQLTAWSPSARGDAPTTP
jgi:iron complex outermembrane receptor protein